MKNLLYVLLTLFPFCAFAQPSITISTPTDTICSGGTIVFTASVSGVPSPNYRWKVNGINTGAEDSVFVTSTLHDGDIVSGALVNSGGYTVLAVSNNITITVQHFLSAGVIHGVDTICLNATVMMTDSITGGVWGAINGYVNDSAGVVTAVYAMGYECGQIPTPDTIIYIVTNTCGSDTAFKPVVIHPYPNVYYYLGYPGSPSYYLCLGQTTLINMGDCSPDGPIVSEYGNTATSWTGVMGIHPGNDVLICSATNFCGTRTSYTSISVVAPPGPTTIAVFDFHFCRDSSIILFTDTAARNFMNTWSATSGILKPRYPREDSAWFIAKKPGVDTIFLSSSNGCGSIYTYVTVTINLPAEINPVGPVCAGRTIQLYDSSTGGTWSIDNTAIATIDPVTGILTTINSGNEVVTYTLPNGCSMTQSLAIGQLPAPVSLPSTLCIDSTVSLTASGSETWSVSPNDIAELNGNYLLGKNEGIATVFLTAANGCYDSASVTVTRCGADESVFPNPSASDATIFADTSVFDSYTMENSIGQVFLKGKLTKPLTELNTSSLPPAFYFISLYGKHKKVIKFLKK